MSTMTLEQVRDAMSEDLRMCSRIDNNDVAAWRNAIDAHLASQPVEQTRGDMRSAFEAWFADVPDPCPLSDYDESSSSYSDFTDDAMWQAWKAASTQPKPEQSNYPEIPDSSNPEQAVGQSLYVGTLQRKLSALVDEIERPVEFKPAKEEYFRAGARAAMIRAIAELEMFAIQQKPEQAVGDGVYAQVQASDGRRSTIEVEAWERFARENGLNMAEHPLHYLFLDEKTATARQAWAAAIRFVLDTPRPAVATAGDGVTDVVAELGRMATDGGVTIDAHDMAIMCSQLADKLAALASRPVEAAPGGVAEGWKLVPKKADKNMHAAFLRGMAWTNMADSACTASDVDHLYGQLLAAAPEVGREVDAY